MGSSSVARRTDRRASSASDAAGAFRSQLVGRAYDTLDVVFRQQIDPSLQGTRHTEAEERALVPVAQPRITQSVLDEEVSACRNAGVRCPSST